MSVRASAVLAFELLGRHVLERAEDRALLRQVPAAVGSAVSLDGGAGGRHRLGEPEIEQLHARPRQHHVGGLQVPVHDALRGAPCRARPRSRSPYRSVCSSGSGPFASRSSERLALEVLHDEVLGLALAADVVERADVRMGELARSSSPPARSAGGLGRGRQMLRQDLDRHGPLEARVARLVDLSHPARADRREDLVGAEPRTGGERQVMRSLQHRRTAPSVRSLRRRASGKLKCL